jgi:hypothetical protein
MEWSVMKYVNYKTLILLVGLIASRSVFAEVQSSMSCTFPTSLAPGYNELYTGQGNGVGFTCDQVSGSAAHNEGDFMLSPGGVVKLIHKYGTGRFDSGTVGTTATTADACPASNSTYALNSKVVRCGAKFDSFVLFQSFLTSNYLTTTSSNNTSCPASTTYSWLGVRLRTADAPSIPQDVSMSGMYIGGVATYNSAAAHPFTGVSVFNAAKTLRDSSSAPYDYYYDGFPTATPSKCSMTIAGISNANPGVVTATSHGFVNGDRIYISGVTGMTLAAGTYKVAGKTANTFQLNTTAGAAVDTSAAGAYTPDSGTVGGAPRRMRLQRGGSFGTSNGFDAYQTLYFGSNSFVMISALANPTVFMGVTQTNLTAGVMEGLADNVFSGIYTRYTDATTQEQLNVGLFATNAAGTAWDIKTVDTWSTTSSFTPYGDLTCASLNNPTTGFCSGSITIGGQSANIICAMRPTSGTDEDTMICTAQSPTDSSVPISIIAQTPKRSQISVTTSTDISTVNHDTTGTATITVQNLTGRKIPLLQAGTGAFAIDRDTPHIPFTHANAFGGANGTCGTSMTGFESCTFTLTYTPNNSEDHGGNDKDGADAMAIYVDYDAGSEGTTQGQVMQRGVAGLLSIDITPKSGIYVDASNKQLTATATFRDGGTQNITDIISSWTSSDTSNATINSSGQVTGVDEGSTNFVANFGSVMAATLSRQIQDGTTWTGRKHSGAGSSSMSGSAPTSTADATNGTWVYTAAVTSGAFTPTAPAGCPTYPGTSAITTYVIQYDQNGVAQWCHLVGAPDLPGAPETIVSQIVADTTHKAVYVMGGHLATTGAGNGLPKVYGGLRNDQTGAAGGRARNIYVAKFWSSGQHAWTRQFGAESIGNVGVGGRITVDETNNMIYLTGRLQHTASTGSVMCDTAYNGTIDAYLMAMNASGNVTACSLIGGGASTTTREGGVGVDADGFVYVAGHTTGAATTIGSGAAGTNSGSSATDTYLIKYAGASTTCGSAPCNTAQTQKWVYQYGSSGKVTQTWFMTMDNKKNAYLAYNSNWATNGETYVSTNGGAYDVGFLKINAASTGTAVNPAITGITKAIPAVVTSTAHGFADGDIVFISGVGGMTEVNGNYYKVANKAANTFQLTSTAGVNIDSSNFTTYTSGGTVGGLVLAKQVGDSDQAAASTSIPFGIAVDNQNGYVYIGGQYNPAIAAGAGKGLDGTTFYGGSGFTDGYMIQYTTSGTKKTVLSYGLASKNYQPYNPAVDNAGNIYWAGFTDGDLDAGSPALTGTKDHTITRYELDADGIMVKK